MSTYSVYLLHARFDVKLNYCGLSYLSVIWVEKVILRNARKSNKLTKWWITAAQPLRIIIPLIGKNYDLSDLKVNNSWLFIFANIGIHCNGIEARFWNHVVLLCELLNRYSHCNQRRNIYNKVSTNRELFLHVNTGGKLFRIFLQRQSLNLSFIFANRRHVFLLVSSSPLCRRRILPDRK